MVEGGDVSSVPAREGFALFEGGPVAREMRAVPFAVKRLAVELPTATLRWAVYNRVDEGRFKWERDVVSLDRSFDLVVEIPGE